MRSVPETSEATLSTPKIQIIEVPEEVDQKKGYTFANLNVSLNSLFLLVYLFSSSGKMDRSFKITILFFSYFLLHFHSTSFPNCQKHSRYIINAMVVAG